MVFMAMLAACKDAVTKNGPKDRFDKLEKVFAAGNWRSINYDDTSYLFFSREGDLHYKIYRYYIEEGDSVNTAVFNIGPQGDSIVMKVDDEFRVLVSVDENGSSWKDQDSEYRIAKIDSSHIELRKDGKVTNTLSRTLPISTFLVRCRYDFTHGTNTADETMDSVRTK